MGNGLEIHALDVGYTVTTTTDVSWGSPTTTTAIGPEEGRRMLDILLRWLGTKFLEPAMIEYVAEKTMKRLGK